MCWIEGEMTQRRKERGGEITDTEKKSVAMKGPKRSENKNVAEQVR